MKNTELSFGIIGCGMIAGWHQNALAQLEHCSLHGVADANREAAETAAEHWHTQAYETVDALLADPKIDAVCICTPSGLHAPLALQAIEAGKHVLIEKPLALTPTDCDRIMAASGRHHVKVGVVSQLRYCRGVRELRHRMEDGELGTILTAELSMRYFRATDYYQKSRWHGTWEMDGGGALLNQGIHGVDLLLYLMGKPKSVSGAASTLLQPIETEDTAAGVLQFESGAVGVICASTAASPGYHRTLRITGTRGSATLTEDTITQLILDGTEQPIPQTDIVSGAGNATGIGYAGHTAQLADFADAIRSDREPAVTAADGKNAVDVIYQIYRCAGIRN